MLIKNDKDKLPKSFSPSFKQRTIKTLFILNFIVVVIIIALFFNSLRFKNNINFRINQISTFFVPEQHKLSLSKMKDIFKYFFISSFSGNQVNKLLINSNFKNTNEFYNQLKISSEGDNNKKYSKGSLVSSSHIFKIKFRPKGDRKIHYRKNKPSFSVEILNGKSFLGMKKFSLQAPAVRGYLKEMLWIELLKKNNIISPNYFYLDFAFNGENMGIYNYEEKPTTFMLERLGYKNSSILKFSEANGIFLKHNPEIKVINDEDVTIQNQNISTSILRNFFEGKSKVNETFDIEKLAIFFAISNLMKSYHGLLEKSMRFYYNPFTNLLEPIPFDGHPTNEPMTLFSSLSLNSDILNNSNVSTWLSFFFNNNNRDFIDLYFEKLKFFSSEKYLNEIFNDKKLKSKIDDAKKILIKDFTFADKFLSPYFFDYVEYLSENASKIKVELNQESNIQFYSSFNNNSIQINSINFDNIIPINIESVETKNYKLKINKKNTFIFQRLEKNILKNFNINDSLLNDILINKKLKINYTSYLGFKFVKNVNLFDYNYSLGGHSNNYLNKLLNTNNAYEENNNIIFKKKNIVLKDFLVIPKNKKLVLNSGQNIFFNDKSGIITYGDLYFNGTPLNPINLFGKNSKTKGTGFITGLGPSSIIMRNVNFSNFSFFDGYDISGSITFYNSKVEMKNVNFIKNFSEDYLNLVNSNFVLENVVFENCKSDCFDSDFSKGKLSNVKFNISGNDGMDLSESEIFSSKIYFNKIGDKAISAGENTNLYMKNININNSEIGIVSKDGSNIQGNNVTIKSVRLPLAIFKKKPRYNNPSIMIKNYFNYNFEIKYLIEKSLNINLNSKQIVGDKSSVENLLYGNNFGTKSKK